MITSEQASEHMKRLAHFSLERALDAVLWIDRDSSIHFANEAAVTRYGYTHEEITSLSILQLNKELNAQKFEELWLQRNEDQSYCFESIHLAKDGREIPVEITMNFFTFEGQDYTCSFVRDLRERIRSRRTLLSLVEGTASVTGMNFYTSLATSITKALDMTYALVTEFANREQTKVRSLAYAEHDRIRDNITYEIEGTPCEIVMQGKEYAIPEKVAEQFPKEAGLEAYFGVPIYNKHGDAIGHIAVLDPNPKLYKPQDLNVLRIFASRAGAEMERDKAEDHLRIALEEVEKLRDRLQAENIYLQQEIKTAANFEEIITQNEGYKAVLRQVEQVAATDATVLILGETGTGKELLARAVHNISNRRTRPLVKVNCASLPAQLIESELFGHEKGAFTGALSLKTGRFELADKGTIFLDEVGELPLELQAKLLRVLQEGEFERLGNAETQHTDVRVIAATNRHLQSMVNAGTFRADLYYRLNVFPITNPPLRERVDDIGLLTKHFTRKYSQKTGRNISQIPKKVINQLEGYNWPGNVRELENVVERAVILSMGKNLEITGPLSNNPAQNGPTAIATMEEAERTHITKALEHTKWKVSGPNGAAHLLGLKPTTLESRMKKLGISRKGKAENAY